MGSSAPSVSRLGLSRLAPPALQARANAVFSTEPSVRLDERSPDLQIVGHHRGVISAAAETGSFVLAILPVGDRRSTTEALDAGAHGVVLEQELESSIGAAARAVCSGLVVVPAAVRQAVRRPMLSSREKQILSMVVVGLTNGEIAGRLHLAESTVKSHLSAVFGKLGVRSRKEAADLVLDPSSGLGPGILSITPPASSTAPYGRPVVA